MRRGDKDLSLRRAASSSSSSSSQQRRNNAAATVPTDESTIEAFCVSTRKSVNAQKNKTLDSRSSAVSIGLPASCSSFECFQQLGLFLTLESQSKTSSRCRPDVALWLETLRTQRTEY